MDPIDERLTRAGAAWRASQPPTVMPPAVPLTGRVTPRGRWRAMAPVAGVLAVVLVAIAALWAVSPRSVVEVAASPSPRAIALLIADAPSTSCQLSWNGGELVRDARSGLGVRTGDGTLSAVRWPVGFTAFEEAGRAVLVDGRGEAVAVDGDIVGFGNGGTGNGIMTACGPSLSWNRMVLRNREVPNFSRPLTTEELLGFVTDPAAVGTTFVADTTLTDTTVSDPATGERWWSATIDGEGGQALGMVDPLVPATLPQDRPLLHGTFAFTVGSAEALMLDGPVALPEAGMPWDAPSLAAAPADAVPVGTLVPVDGWLRVVPGRCLGDCTQVRVDDRRWYPGDERRTDGVVVQPDAWARFGAIAGLDVTLPRYGTWLLRRERVPTDETAIGWSVVAKLPELRSVALPVPVPTLASPAPGTGGCRGIGLDATLTGDPHDPRVTWLIDRASEARIEVVWPAGYRARFAPFLEVLDATGAVVLRERDLVTEGCTAGKDEAGHRLVVPTGWTPAA